MRGASARAKPWWEPVARERELTDPGCRALEMHKKSAPSKLEGMLVDLDLDSLAAAYRSGSYTPEQLVDALYAVIARDADNPAWIWRPTREAALAEARALKARAHAAELPLYGVPFGVKDNIDVAGMPTTAGCPAYSYVAERSAPTVEALLAAGALCLGKLNLDQFATGLVGTRSPYGSCHNVFDEQVLSGGSSSGSGVAVAAHHVCFALGTDTAGSGRVPAALNNVVGLKPSVGLLSSEGVVPACASLDCVSVFALSVADAVRIRGVMTGSAHASLRLPRHFRFGIPERLHSHSDASTEALFARAVDTFTALGGELVKIDFAPFLELGDMLYGPSVVERTLAVGGFIKAHREDVLPVTRDIILSGDSVDDRAQLAGMKAIARLRHACTQRLRSLDFLLTPTIPRPYTLAEDRASPRDFNDRLGVYTRFVNYLGAPVVSVPAGFRDDGLPFGVSLVGKLGEDAKLDTLAAELHARSGAGAGKRRVRVHPLSEPDAETHVRVAVAGAHMRGLALNGQLTELGARYCETTRTTAQYRFYVLPGGPPERPGLVRVGGGGHAIEVEVWRMSPEALGKLMTRVPSPLCIGSLELASGELVKGFLCEEVATRDAREISSFGGYRAYLAQ